LAHPRGRLASAYSPVYVEVPVVRAADGELGFVIDGEGAEPTVRIVSGSLAGRVKDGDVVTAIDGKAVSSATAGKRWCAIWRERVADAHAWLVRMRRGWCARGFFALVAGVLVAGAFMAGALMRKAKH
jgi:hypothetical protein